MRIIRYYSPDIIVITGDIIDSYHPKIDISVDFVKQAQRYAPIYYVNGNHELRIRQEYEDFKSKINGLDITVLENEKIEINRNGQIIDLLGVNDPSVSYVDGHIDDRQNMINQLDALDCSSNNYKILLSHRPESFDIYCQRDFNLVFCGHAHGGQIILPHIGGLYSQNQGFFPKYTSGIFTQGKTKMIVSRGLGNNAVLARVNNNSQVVIATLKSE